MYKIQWSHHTEEEATWETEDYLHRQYPGFLSSTSGTLSLSLLYSSNLGMRFTLRGVGCDTSGVCTLKDTPFNSNKSWKGMWELNS